MIPLELRNVNVPQRNESIPTESEGNLKINAILLALQQIQKKFRNSTDNDIPELLSELKSQMNIIEKNNLIVDIPQCDE
jgi:hypothetical protein